ncbi:hypothetical protein [Mesorhizobium hawassense]|uniref:hypothetical protein n=1 Tax=Mesorhizobium hawassense TaxID=1209954 RepID=UPI001FE0B194|nr:hypothetical protein [Mesorhizobium hawassense]
MPAELGLLAGWKAHHLRVEFELLEGQRGPFERPAGQPAGIDRFVDLWRPAAGHAGATAVGIGSDAVYGAEIERQARGQLLAVLLEGVGKAVDEPHLAAALVIVQRGEVAPVEPVDDADQTEAREVRLQPAHVDDAADIAVGDFVESSPTDLHVCPQCRDIGGHRVDDGVVGRRLIVKGFQVVAAIDAEQAGKAVSLGIERSEHARVVDDGDGMIGGTHRLSY